MFFHEILAQKSSTASVAFVENLFSQMNTLCMKLQGLFGAERFVTFDAFVEVYLEMNPVNMVLKLDIETKSFSTSFTNVSFDDIMYVVNMSFHYIVVMTNVITKFAFVNLSFILLVNVCNVSFQSII